MLATIELRDWVLIIQVTIGLLSCLATWIALYIVYNQLQMHAKVLRLNSLAARHQMFFALTDAVTDDVVNAMLLHVVDHFEANVFRERYEGHEDRIRSYLLMKRKYLYLLFATWMEKAFPVDEKGVARAWIVELARYHEFRDVHSSQKHYYPEFRELVDSLITGLDPASCWMCESHKNIPTLAP